MIEAEELVGLYEIAKMATVSPPAVANWRKRNADFPTPIVQLKSGPVFRKTDVRAWLKRKAKRRTNGKNRSR